MVSLVTFVCNDVINHVFPRSQLYLIATIYPSVTEIPLIIPLPFSWINRENNRTISTIRRSSIFAIPRRIYFFLCVLPRFANSVNARTTTLEEAKKMHRPSCCIIQLCTMFFFYTSAVCMMHATIARNIFVIPSWHCRKLRIRATIEDGFVGVEAKVKVDPHRTQCQSFIRLSCLLTLCLPFCCASVSFARVFLLLFWRNFRPQARSPRSSPRFFRIRSTSLKKIRSVFFHRRVCHVRIIEKLGQSIL